MTRIHRYMSGEANFTQYGDQTLQMGLPDAIKTLIPGMAVTSLKPNWEPEFIDRATGTEALTISVAVGEDKIMFEGSGYLIDEADFTANKSFTYNNRLHIFVKKGGAFEAGKFQKCDFSTESYSLITS